MGLFNHTLPFRPLRGGTEIFNPRVNEVGTLGFNAQALKGGPGRWLVSCYHVLVGGQNDLPVNGDPVLQPSSNGNAIARVDAARCDAVLDCAAAKIESSIETSASILGIGSLGPTSEPVVGDVVTKSGSTTGVTEGVIDEVQDDTVIIRIATGFDSNYDLSLRGDSGSLWIRRNDLSPVALHLSELGDTHRRIKARRLSSVLESLKLKLL